MSRDKWMDLMHVPIRETLLNPEVTERHEPKKEGHGATLHYSRRTTSMTSAQASSQNTRSSQTFSSRTGMAILLPHSPRAALRVEKVRMIIMKRSLAIVAIASTIAVAASSCSSTSDEHQKSENGASMSSVRASSGTPWTNEEVRKVVPAGIEHLSPYLRQCNEEDIEATTLICVNMHGTGELYGQTAWIRAVQRTRPVNSADFDNQNAIYRAPMFTVARVPERDRERLGEFAFTTRKDDETQVWSLDSDRVFIQIGYPQGSIDQDELWDTVGKILEGH